MGLIWRSIDNVADFTRLARPFFLVHESRYVIILNMLTLIEARELEGFDYWVLLDGEECCGAVVISPKGNVYSSSIPIQYIHSCISCIETFEKTLLRITAPSETARAIVQGLSGDFELEMTQGIFECSKVVLPPDDGGCLVQAADEHEEIAGRLLQGFLRDCFPDEPDPVEVAAVTKRAIAANNVFLWQNAEGHFVSMAAKVRQTDNTTSISWVYTPDEHRRCGYGSKATAYLSELSLDEERPLCNLFTDASNPTSNRIYQKIGYIKCGEQLIYKLKEKKDC